MIDFEKLFPAGLEYGEFLERHGTEEHRRRWAEVNHAIRLTSSQVELLGAFPRDMPVICLAGAWCGDCVNQCPIFDHFASASSHLQIRFFDRDMHPELGAELKICGGARVPSVVFLSEDFTEVGRYGDRTLSKYRQLVRDQTGPSCPSGLATPDPQLLAAVVQDWLNEFERAQCLLRLSSRLRQKHGD